MATSNSKANAILFGLIYTLLDVVNVRSAYHKDLSDDDREIFDKFFPDIIQREKKLDFFSKVSTSFMAVLGSLLGVIELFNLWQFIALATIVGYISAGIIVAAVLVKFVVVFYQRQTVEIPRNKLLEKYGDPDSENLGVLNAFAALKEIKTTASDLRVRLFMMGRRLQELDKFNSPEYAALNRLVQGCKDHINEAEYVLDEESIDLICKAILYAADDKIVNPKNTGRFSKLLSTLGFGKKETNSQEKLNHWIESEKFRKGFYRLTGMVFSKDIIKNQDIFHELHQYLLEDMPKISASLTTLETILYSLPLDTPKDAKYSRHDLEKIAVQLEQATRIKKEAISPSTANFKAKDAVEVLVSFNDVVESAMLNQAVTKPHTKVRRGLVQSIKSMLGPRKSRVEPPKPK